MASNPKKKKELTSGSSAKDELTTELKQIVNEWFPDLHSATNFVPPFHFNRVPHETKSIEGQSLAVLIPPVENAPAKKTQAGAGTTQSEAACSHVVYDSHVRDDQAQQRLRQCLYQLSQARSEEVMVVVTQLQFGHYLNKPDHPKKSAYAQYFQRPADLLDQNNRRTRGDFDVLIIHKKYGLIACEVKSVGSKREKIKDLNTHLIDRVQKAAKQMQKSEEVLKHIVSDLSVDVTTCLILTGVTSQELKAALNQASESGADEARKLQQLLPCLGVDSAEEAVNRCLCAEQICLCLDEEQLKGVEDWWKITVGRKPHTDLSPDVYEDLVARFCGPATTVKVPIISTSGVKEMEDIRTHGQGVALTGLQFKELALYPEQVALVECQASCKFLTGPPGTGKSIVLYLVGYRWVRAGHRVIIVCINKTGRAACYSLEGQLLESLKEPEERQRVVVCCFDVELRGVESAVSSLAGLAKDGQLHIIMDELNLQRDKFNSFCEKLRSKVPRLNLWAASLNYSMKPDFMGEQELEVLTTPLRSPPNVVAAISEAGEMKQGRVYRYRQRTTPPPTLGPPITWLDHRDGVDGHQGHFPSGCRKCGERVADILIHQLQVNAEGTNNLQLRYKDVFVLVRYPRDEGTDSKGNVTHASVIVQELRRHNIPVLVLNSESPDEVVREVAHFKTDKVVVAEPFAVMGLERSVVFATAHKQGYDFNNKLNAVSRCKSQLFCFCSTKEKPGADSDTDSDNSDSSDT